LQITLWPSRALRWLGRTALFIVEWGIVAVVGIPAVYWLGRGINALLTWAFGTHKGAVWNLLEGGIFLVTWVVAFTLLQVILTGGMPWPWVLAKRRRVLEKFRVGEQVDVIGRSEKVWFAPADFVVAQQPCAAIALDKTRKALRLTSLDLRGDATLDVAMIERATLFRGSRRYPIGRRHRWRRILLLGRSPMLVLHIHASDYARPVQYFIGFRRQQLAELRAFHALLQEHAGQHRPGALLSSEQLAAILPRYHGLPTRQIDSLWPPRPKEQAAIAAEGSGCTASTY
jgi:hypothetical protein